MTKATKIVSVTLAFGLAAVIGTVTIAYISLNNMRVGFFTPKDVEVLRAAAEAARAAALKNQGCSFTITEHGVGDKRQEAMMLYVASMVDLYQVSFGTLPTSLRDLEKLRTFDKASVLNGRQLEQSCTLYSDTGGAFVVSCGGLRPSGSEVSDFMRKAEYSQKFYTLGGAEILYVPASKCS